MKKIITIIAMMFVAVFALAGPASATYPKPDADNKKVTICHATGSSSNPYTKNEISVKAFYQSGHIDHANDIWASFTYTTEGGQTVTVPARGDQSRLAFKNCKKPDEDEKVAKPEPVYNDLCGTENDVFSVAPGRGYTVSNIVNEGNNMVITVTLEPDFQWADGSRNALRFVKPPFTDEDCDLPATGGEAKYNYMLGGAGIALLALAGGAMVVARKRD